MTEPHRTVAAERDLSRIHQWLDTAVAHAVNDAAKALNAIRYWCDQTEAQLCPDTEDCDVCVGQKACVTAVRALLPAVSETSERRAETGEEVISDARDASDVPRRRGRPGLEVDPSP